MGGKRRGRERKGRKWEGRVGRKWEGRGVGKEEGRRLHLGFGGWTPLNEPVSFNQCSVLYTACKMRLPAVDCVHISGLASVDFTPDPHWLRYCTVRYIDITQVKTFTNVFF